MSSRSGGSSRTSKIFSPFPSSKAMRVPSLQMMVLALGRDYPDKIAARVGARAVIYSLFGYGRSDGLLGPRSPQFMHQEALEVLPALLDQLEIDRPLLVGHSDGASIALIHAAASGRA